MDLHRSFATSLVWIIAALAVTPCLMRSPAWAGQNDPSAAAIQEIVETFAKSAVDSGLAVGVAVGVTYRGRPPQLFAYGTADAATGAAVTPDTIFEMGSVTKVFTTALLADAALDGTVKLNEPLSRFQTLLGPMLRPTQSVTLLNLGDFTSGLLRSTPPECKAPQDPLGCLPNSRPTISEYGAQDLLDFFRAFSAPHLPGPYFYSDISAGLIGLILGSNPNAPMGNDAVQGWMDLVRQRITDPLGMKDTFLYHEDASPSQHARLAGGYEPPLVEATASNGGLSITGASGGRGYLSDPAVTVTGGGGSGAVVKAKFDKAGAVSLMVKEPGQGYVAPPEVVFSPPSGSSSKLPTARAIISNGRVIGIRILDRGSGYSPKHLPSVSLVGGTAGSNARTATLAPATVSDGGVDFVRVIDGGAGYVDPISVIVAPGTAFDNAVPVWAPGGALKSSIRDMLSFTEAALDHQFVNGVRVDSRLRSAFKTAQKGYICDTSTEDRDGRPCTTFSGLAWAITPADGGMREIVVKNGGLAGFTTEVRLVPSIDLGVVVFVNSNQTPFVQADQPGEKSNTKPPNTAGVISDNIMYAIAREKLP